MPNAASVSFIAEAARAPPWAPGPEVRAWAFYPGFRPTFVALVAFVAVQENAAGYDRSRTRRNPGFLNELLPRGAHGFKADENTAKKPKPLRSKGELTSCIALIAFGFELPLGLVSFGKEYSHPMVSSWLEAIEPWLRFWEYLVTERSLLTLARSKRRHEEILLDCVDDLGKSQDLASCA